MNHHTSMLGITSENRVHLVNLLGMEDLSRSHEFADLTKQLHIISPDLNQDLVVLIDGSFMIPIDHFAMVYLIQSEIMERMERYLQKEKGQKRSRAFAVLLNFIYELGNILKFTNELPLQIDHILLSQHSEKFDPLNYTPPLIPALVIVAVHHVVFLFERYCSILQKAASIPEYRNMKRQLNKLSKSIIEKNKNLERLGVTLYDLYEQTPPVKQAMANLCSLEEASERFYGSLFVWRNNQVQIYNKMCELMSLTPKKTGDPELKRIRLQIDRTHNYCQEILTYIDLEGFVQDWCLQHPLLNPSKSDSTLYPHAKQDAPSTTSTL